MPMKASKIILMGTGPKGTGLSTDFASFRKFIRGLKAGLLQIWLIAALLINSAGPSYALRPVSTHNKILGFYSKGEDPYGELIKQDKSHRRPIDDLFEGYENMTFHQRWRAIGGAWKQLGKDLLSLPFIANLERSVYSVYKFPVKFKDFYYKSDESWIRPSMLKEAVLYGLANNRFRLLRNSLAACLGGKIINLEQIKEIEIQHFQEGSYQFVFEVKVILRGGRCVRFPLFVSKQMRDNEDLEREFKTMKYLHSVDPRYIAEVFDIAEGMFKIHQGFQEQKYDFTRGKFYTARLGRGDRFMLKMYTGRWLEGHIDLTFIRGDFFNNVPYYRSLARDILWPNYRSIPGYTPPKEGEGFKEDFFVMRSKRIKEQFFKILTTYYIKTEGRFIDNPRFERGDVMWRMGGEPGELVFCSARWLNKYEPINFLENLFQHLEYFPTRGMNPDKVDFLGRPYDVINGVRMALEECFEKNKAHNILRQWLRDYIDRYDNSWLYQGLDEYADKEARRRAGVDAVRRYLEMMDKPVSIKIGKKTVYVERGTTIHEILRQNNLKPDEVEVYLSLHDAFGEIDDSLIVDKNDYGLQVMPFDNLIIEKVFWHPADITLVSEPTLKVVRDAERKVVATYRRFANILPDGLEYFTGTVDNLRVEPFGEIRLGLEHTFIFQGIENYSGYPISAKLRNGTPLYFTVDRSLDGKEPLRIPAEFKKTWMPSFFGNDADIYPVRVIKKDDRFRMLYAPDYGGSISDRRNDLVRAILKAIKGLPQPDHYNAKAIIAYFPFFKDTEESTIEEKIAKHLDLPLDYVQDIVASIGHYLESNSPELFEPILHIRSKRMDKACSRGIRKLYDYKREDAKKIMRCIRSGRYKDTPESTCEEKIAKRLKLPLQRVLNLLLELRLDTKALGPYYKKENRQWHHMLWQASWKRKEQLKAKRLTEEQARIKLIASAA